MLTNECQLCPVKHISYSAGLYEEILLDPYVLITKHMYLTYKTKTTLAAAHVSNKLFRT